jgi:type I restriction enzyme, S subunit
VSDHVGRAFAVDWSEIERWSPGSFRQMDWKWPREIIRPLSSALRRRLEVVDRSEHPLDSLTFGSLHFTGELSHRDMTSKLQVKGKLCFAHANDVVYSKIDARNGAIGIVPESMPRVVFSSEYPIYEVDAAVALPEYVKLLFRMSSFRERINSLISGASGRKRVEPSTLESIEVPLPPLSTQQAIVDQWKITHEKNAAALKAAEEHEADISREFLEKLGLSNRTQMITQRAFALRWTEIERWSIEFIRQSSDDLEPDRGLYPVVKLGDVIADLSNGWSPQCLSRPAEGNEWGVLKLGSVSLGSFNPDQNKALPLTLSPNGELEIKQGDVLISRANITRLVGACAHVTTTPPRLLLCDKIFRVVPKADPPITPEYIAEVLKLPHLRRQIESSVTGSSPTMKNITKPALLGLRIPLPPLPIQKQLVAEVTQARSKIAAERAAAAKLAAETAREVEAMILGQLPVPAGH